MVTRLHKRIFLSTLSIFHSLWGFYHPFGTLQETYQFDWITLQKKNHPKWTKNEKKTFAFRVKREQKITDVDKMNEFPRMKLKPLITRGICLWTKTELFFRSQVHMAVFQLHLRLHFELKNKLKVIADGQNIKWCVGSNNRMYSRVDFKHQNL